MALFACFSRPPNADSEARQKRDSERFFAPEDADFSGRLRPLSGWKWWIAGELVDVGAQGLASSLAGSSIASRSL
jgi:hypothetical protein